MDNPEFVHIHNHSYYSLLDGLSSPKDLVECASDLGYKSMALTDHGSCAGLFSFNKECEDRGIKPILGTETYITEDHTVKQKDGPMSHHLVLLAKNRIGYKNLIYLSSFGYINGFYYKPRIDFNILEKHKEGLIVSSACGKGEVPYALWNDNPSKAREIASKYRDVFGDDYYIEVMMHNYYNNKKQQDKERKTASLLYKLSKEMGIKAICTQDTHYARREEWEAQDVLLCIQTLDRVKNPDRFSFCSKDFYMKPISEMAKLYAKAPDLLSNTLEISEKIEKGLITLDQDLLPNFDLPPGVETEDHYLKQLVKSGMEQFGLVNKKEYRERIKYEMSVIVRCKYTKYFLILWDIINFANTKGIRVGVGRGSGVSSLVLYCLGITKLDPIKYELIFERFLNPDRISPPDVDIDFDYDRREEVNEYVVHKYGSDYSSHIGTYNSYKAKAAIRSTAKALDLGKDWEIHERKQKDNPDAKIEFTKNSLNVADDLSKMIPLKAKSIEGALKMDKSFRNAMARFPKLLECATRIEGVLSSGGVHPSGVLMSKDKIIDHVPLRVSNGVVATQYDMNEVEKIGLLKFDLLAIKNLTLIDTTLKMVKKRYDKEYDIDRMEPNDQKVFQMFNGEKRNNTVGLFQFESPGMVKLLRNIHVDTFEDLIVAVSLYRPGPLGAGVDNLYCNYKHGRQDIEYLHPKLGEVLKSTYGSIVFQENVMQVAQQIAGFTGGQADTLRKAIGKKIPELLAEQKDLFVDGCVKNNVDKKIAEKIFEQIDYFGGYGFNRSHACAYAYISYQEAFLKTYHPLEYMCNLLTSEINNNDKGEKLEAYQRETKRMGHLILPEHINRSGLTYRIEQGHDKELNKDIWLIRKPLTGLKGIGTKAVQSIVESQPYESLSDFVGKIDARVVNIKVFNTLVDAGCMGSWDSSKEALKQRYPEIKKLLEKERKAKKKKQEKLAEHGGESLFEDSTNFDYSGKDLTF